MLTKLKELASPSLYIAGHANIRGLQSPSPDALQAVGLIIHLIQNLLEELTPKLTDVRNLVAEVKKVFRVVVPTYRWDMEQKNFVRISGLGAGNFM
jgi:hypothetical protein